jgi:cytochrome oxidase Cu insertion factor (SCO1/SenC/PrrC family)
MALAAAGLAAAFSLAACGSEEPADDEPTTADSMESTEGTTEAMTTEAGMAVPELLDFTATTLDGEEFEGASLAGTPAVLWFWYEDCPICQGQGPDVAALQEEYGDTVNIVGVSGAGLSGSSTVEQMQSFVDDTGTGAITHLESADGELWTRFEVTSQSTYVLIDSHGEVVETGPFSGDELSEKTGDLS